MSDPSRLARFVGSARRLLVFQLLASAGAVALTAWAVIEVQAVVEENERLETRVAELEAVRPGVLADPVAEMVPEVSATPEETLQPGKAGLDTTDENGGGSPTPPPPPPTETCYGLDDSEIDCVPPFRRVPGSNVCIDGANRDMRCPEGVTETVTPQPQAERPARFNPRDALPVIERLIGPARRTREPTQEESTAACVLESVANGLSADRARARCAERRQQ